MDWTSYKKRDDPSNWKSLIVTIAKFLIFFFLTTLLSFVELSAVGEVFPAFVSLLLCTEDPYDRNQLSKPHFFPVTIVKQIVLTCETKFVDKFADRNKKNKQQHSILRIRIGLGTTFQHKQRILIFGTKLAQKGYLLSRTKKKKKKCATSFNSACWN